uniref:Uncharacterized protein n=1 Tax=Rangifer tarandus platyrhynchus TaxID=3082113 RepID=A0ACB0E513_RANTA|nr:unnamed protein product [Rangifer tarandus platyrhynchus]
MARPGNMGTVAPAPTSELPTWQEMGHRGRTGSPPDSQRPPGLVLKGGLQRGADPPAALLATPGAGHVLLCAQRAPTEATTARVLYAPVAVGVRAGADVHHSVCARVHGEAWHACAHACASVQPCGHEHVHRNVCSLRHHGHEDLLVNPFAAGRSEAGPHPFRQQPPTLAPPPAPSPPELSRQAATFPAAAGSALPGPGGTAVTLRSTRQPGRAPRLGEGRPDAARGRPGRGTHLWRTPSSS